MQFKVLSLGGTVGQNEVWVKKNISLIKPTPFERSGQYLSETVDEKIRTWQLFEKSAKMWFLCMSNFFFKQKATVAKPMDFDDFYRFVLTNHDLFMVRKWILTLSIQKKHVFWYPEVDQFFKFYSYFNAVAQPNLHCWTGFSFIIIFLVKFWWFSFFLLPL